MNIKCKKYNTLKQALEEMSIYIYISLSCYLSQLPENHEGEAEGHLKA